MPGVDAEHDFMRARRHAVLARLAARLRRKPAELGLVVPYGEVIAALGYRSERRIGRRVVPLAAIVGTVDRARQFDRRFRPRSALLRERWERINAAMRRGDPMPPVDLLKIGEAYFVRDGHHRVSVSRALGRKEIDAIVTEVFTKIAAAPAVGRRRWRPRRPRRRR